MPKVMRWTLLPRYARSNARSSRPACAGFSALSHDWSTASRLQAVSAPASRARVQSWPYLSGIPAEALSFFSTSRTSWPLATPDALGASPSRLTLTHYRAALGLVLTNDPSASVSALESRGELESRSRDTWVGRDALAAPGRLPPQGCPSSLEAHASRPRRRSRRGTLEWRDA